MKFQDYLTNRKVKLEEVLTAGTPYLVSQYTNARDIYGDEIFIAYDEIPDETIRRFICGVLTHIGGTGQCLYFNKELHRQYIDILFDIATDLYNRAIEGKLDCKQWFRQFATEQGIISEMQGHIIRTAVTDERVLYWEIFTRYFFGWYSNWEEMI